MGQDGAEEEVKGSHEPQPSDVSDGPRGNAEGAADAGASVTEEEGGDKSGEATSSDNVNEVQTQPQESVDAAGAPAAAEVAHAEQESADAAVTGPATVVAPESVTEEESTAGARDADPSAAAADPAAAADKEQTTASTAETGTGPEDVEDAAAEEEDEEDPDDIVVPLGYLLNAEGQPTPYPGAFSLFLTDTTLDRVGIPDLNDESEVLHRFVEKDVILKDISFRGKISDFQVIKSEIEKAEVDSVIIRANVDNVYGDDNNYEVGTTAAICEEWASIQRLKELKRKKEEERAAAEAAGAGKPRRRKKRAKKVKVIPVSKEWVSQGSEHEILASKTWVGREPISVSFARSRREFNQSLEFTDKDAQELWNGSQMECRPYKDVKFDLQRSQFDAGSQCVGEKSEKEVQATRQPLVNKSTQYEAKTLLGGSKAEAREALKIMESDGFTGFLSSIENRCDSVLQQNEVMNIFEDDFAALADEDSAPGNRSEATISEYQSFTHLTYSKNKLVSSIDWLPNRRGIVAVACTEPMSFDERIAQAGRVKTSAILIWNFRDPIHPQCVLESPSDIMCFRFNEERPELVAGGMYNGQVVLWDTSEATTKKPSSHVKTGMGSAGHGHAGGSGGSGGGDDGATGGSGGDGGEEASIPVIKCKYLSSIDSSHTYPVSDLCWMKEDMTVDGSGRLVRASSSAAHPSSATGDAADEEDAEAVEGADPNSTAIATSSSSSSAAVTSTSSSSGVFMFITTSADGRVLFWDTAPKRDTKKKDDIVWTPKYAIRLSRLEKGGHLGCSRLSMSTNLSSTRFFCGSHDGEVAYVDFDGSNNASGGGSTATDALDVTKVVTDGHFGPVNALDRSPFFPDILLSVGDWTFKVWKEGKSTPIYSSPCSAAYLTTGCWSPTRPGVIYTARTDGVLEVWDLLDRSHEPSMTVSASSASITALEFLKEKESSMTQRMAVGDRQGVLHIMDLPRNLRKAAVGEKGTMMGFFERELKRADAVSLRAGSPSALDNAAEVAAEKDNDATQSGFDPTAPASVAGTGQQVSPGAAAASGHAPDADSFMMDMEKQEAEYLKLERDFMSSLGIDSAATAGSSILASAAQEIQAN